MLNLIPLTRPGRKVTDGDPQAEIISQCLQANFPQARPAAIAATPIGSDQQFSDAGVELATHLQPPAAYRLGGKLCRIVVNPYADQPWL